MLRAGKQGDPQVADNALPLTSTTSGQLQSYFDAGLPLP